MTENATFESWAIVEIFGHQQIAGLMTEQVIAGQGFVRVDVPATPGRAAFTRMFGPSAIYSIIPTTEDVATRFAERQVQAPVQLYQLAPALPSKIVEDIDDSEMDGYDPGADLGDGGGS